MSLDLDRREGRFGRWLALIAGVSGAMSGIEVSYEHYKAATAVGLCTRRSFWVSPYLVPG
ncbi:MAG: hypothetical protein M3Y21_00485 [Candidatus Eremiobacteraeota bacterium]|nr:hypothetical protein [Candidatus Eremiobacteraeota bacterium]